MNMALNNLLLFSAPASKLTRRSMRARPADVIPIRRHRQRHHGLSSNALFVSAGIVVWLAAVLLALAAFRRSTEWANEFVPTWPWWPLW